MTLFELAAFAATLDEGDYVEICGDTMQAAWWNGPRLVAMVALV